MIESAKQPRKWLWRALKGLGGLLSFAAVAVVAILVVLSTTWGKEQLRGFAESRLRAVFVGGGTIGKIDGSVLGDLFVHDLVINDASGQPAIVVAKARIRSRVLPLIGRTIHLEEVDISGLQIHGRLDRNGQPNLATLFIDDETPSAFETEIDKLTVSGSALTLALPGRPLEVFDDLRVDATQVTLSQTGVKMDLGATTLRHRGRNLDIALAGAVSMTPERIEATKWIVSVAGAQLRIDTAALEGGELAELAGSLVVPASTVQTLLPAMPWRLDTSLRFRSQGPSVALEGLIGTATLAGSAAPPSKDSPAKISLALSTLDLSSLWPGLPSSALDLQLEASLEDAKIQATLTAVGTVLEQHLDAAEVSVSLLGEQLKAGVIVREAGTTLVANAEFELGEVPKLISSKLVFDSEELAHLAAPWLELGGDLHVTLEADGALETAHVSGSIQSTHLHAFGLQLRRLTVKPDLTRRGDRAIGKLSMSALSLRSATTIVNDVHLDIHSEDGHSARVELAGQGRGVGVKLAAGLRLEKTTLAVDLEQAKAHYRGLRLHGAFGRVRWTFAGPRHGLISLEDLELRSSAGTLSSSGAIRIGGRPRGKLKVDARHIDLATIARALQLRVPLRGMLSMKARLDSREGGQGDLEFDLAGIGIGEMLPLASGKLTLRLRQRGLLADLEASMPGAATLSCTARVHAPQNPLDLSRWATLDRRALVSIDGSATVNAAAFAGLHAALPRSGRLELRAKQEQGTQLVTVDLKARTLHSSRFAEPGDVDLHLDLEATKIGGTARLRVGPQMGATLASTLRLPGPWFAADSYRDVSLDSIETLDLSTTEIEVDGLLRNLGVTVDTSGAFAQARLAYAAGTKSFELGVSATIPKGGAKQRRVAQSLTLHASVGEHELSADLIGSVDDSEKLRADGTFAVGWSELLTATPDLSQVPVSAQVVVTSLPLLAVREIWRTTPAAAGAISTAPDMNGTLNVSAELSGRLTAPELEANASIDDAMVAGVAFSRITVESKLRAGTIEVSVGGAQVAGGELKIRARTALAGGPNTAISATIMANDFDLQFLNELVAHRALGGRLTANLRATGTRGKPELTGNATLAKGSFNPGAPLHMVTAADLRFDLFKDKIVMRGKLRSGRGLAKLSGAVGMVDNRPRDLTFAVETTKLPLAAGPLNVLLDSRTQLVGTYQRDTLSLAVDIESATLNLPGGLARTLHPTDLPDDVIVSTGRATTEHSGGLPSVPLEVAMAIRSKNNILIKGGEANASLGVSLDLTVGKAIQATGAVQVDQGWLKLFGRRYEIRTAAASFSGDQDPTLNVQLAHEFDVITLFIDVSGHASRPVVELRSEPSIFDTAELLAFVLGANPDQPETDGGGVSKGVATGLLSGKLSSIVANATPIDLLRIDTDDSSAERVALGKWITEKLLIAYRHRFTADPKTNADELVFEFRLLKRWLLEGFVGQQVIGADALWIHRY